MSRPLRFLGTILVLACSVFAAGEAYSAAALERGTAIIDPLALRELDRGRLGLGRIMLPAATADAPLANGRLFALPSMAPVRKALDAEFDRYSTRHRADFPDESVGVGTPYDVQLFDRSLLYRRRFAFRAVRHHQPDGPRLCLAGWLRRNQADLPADANKPAGAGRGRGLAAAADDAQCRAEGQSRSCRRRQRRDLGLRRDRAALARCRRVAAATGAELAAKLTARDGPLDLIRPDNIDRIETNLQIAHAPKTPRHDFRTDYLLKVFRYDAQAQRFEQAPLENQIDRERIAADPELRREFRAWLLDPGHFVELDRGTILLPDKFLASRAIAATPVGFDPSKLQPAFGLVQGDDAATEPVFSDHDVVAALQQAAERGISLQNIRSVAGFERRLNDITCAGCHQTRSIGGFHFPGVDWMAARPSNSTVVPGSPHFFGDQVRRRDILVSLRDGRAPDYSRGFSSRPQLRGSTELAGTEYQDGWGAHCYRQMPDAKDNDLSFTSWSCARGLACQVVGARSRMGMCFINPRERSGPPLPPRPD